MRRCHVVAVRRAAAVFQRRSRSCSGLTINSSDNRHGTNHPYRYLFVVPWKTINNQARMIATESDAGPPKKRKEIGSSQLFISMHKACRRRVVSYPNAAHDAPKRHRERFTQWPTHKDNKTDRFFFVSFERGDYRTRGD